MAQVAWEEAASHYERALQALDLEEKPDEARRCELLIALGDAQMMTGEPVAGGKILQSAAGVARDRGRPELLVRAALGYGGRNALTDEARACTRAPRRGSARR